MIFGVEENKKLICSMCNMIVTKIIPLYDKDLEHTGIQCCKRCKKHIRSGIQEPITKFKRDAAIYKALEDNFNQQAGKRKIVERV